MTDIIFSFNFVMLKKNTCWYNRFFFTAITFGLTSFWKTCVCSDGHCTSNNYNPNFIKTGSVIVFLQFFKHRKNSKNGQFSSFSQQINGFLQYNLTLNHATLFIEFKK